MKLNILAFGIAKDIIGQRDFSLEISTDSPNVHELLTHIQHAYPAFTDLASLRVAVNSEYVENDCILSESDEIVLIPPVSGG